MPEYRHIDIGQPVTCEIGVYQEQQGDGGIRHISRIHNMLMRSYWSSSSQTIMLLSQCRLFHHGIKSKHNLYLTAVPVAGRR